MPEHTILYALTIFLALLLIGHLMYKYGLMKFPSPPYLQPPMTRRQERRALKAVRKEEDDPLSEPLSQLLCRALYASADIMYESNATTMMSLLVVMITYIVLEDFVGLSRNAAGVLGLVGPFFALVAIQALRLRFHSRS